MAEEEEITLYRGAFIEKFRNMKKKISALLSLKTAANRNKYRRNMKQNEEEEGNENKRRRSENSKTA